MTRRWIEVSSTDCRLVRYGLPTQDSYDQIARIEVLQRDRLNGEWRLEVLELLLEEFSRLTDAEVARQRGER